MISEKLKEILTGCLLRDILQMESAIGGTDSSSERFVLMQSCYGIKSRTACLIAASVPEALLPENSPSYLVDCIDKCFLELPEHPMWSALRSPFVNDREKILYYDPAGRIYGNSLNFADRTSGRIPAGLLKKICEKTAGYCRECYSNRGFLQGLLDLLENECSYLSCEGGTRSVFETAKLRAGLATCLYQCLEERGIWDYQGWAEKILSAKRSGKEEEFPVVLVCSLDFLGIKDFKFQPLFADSLKNVAAASFYIDLFRENVLDDFLEAAGITRCNLIFSGGRHLHLFLPARAGMKDFVKERMRKLNGWLVRQYQLDLYVSYGMQEANSLYQVKCPDDYYLNIFTRIANQKALVEAQKYTAADLEYMNRIFVEMTPERWNKETLNRIQVIAKTFPAAGYYVVSEDEDKGIPIGPGRFVYAGKELPKDGSICRVYSPKKDNETLYHRSNLPLVRIWHEEVGAPDIPLCRIDDQLCGMLRMDIDNFRVHMLHSGKAIHMMTPPEKMELSRHFAFFLRRDVPRLLDDYRADGEKEGRFCTLCVIHEGADDMFIFGELEQLIHFAGLMYKYYRCFTQGNISFSAGISIYNPNEPLAANANLAQELMDRAKTMPGKDGIVLKDSALMFKWEDFIADELRILNLVSGY